MRGRYLFAVLAAAAVPALAEDWQVCAPSPLPFSPASSARLSVTNNALSYATIWLCTGGAGAGNCTAATSAAACPQVLPGNGTAHVNISSGGVTGLLLAYHSTEPFAWHALASAPTQAVPWPPAGGLAAVTLTAPATPGLLMCDGDADCPAGAGPCVPAPAPPRCAAPVPPAPSAWPTFAPLPTPAAGPPAATCTLSKDWQQSNTSAAHAHMLRHVADAYVTIAMAAGAGGAFNWTCTSSRGPCPGHTTRLNGTGVLSAVDGTFALAPNWQGPARVSGFVNSTYACQALWIPSWGVQWTSMDPPPPAATDLTVSAATFLGAGGALLAPVGVAVLAAPAGGPALIAVAVNGRTAAYPGVVPQLLLNASAATYNGSVLILSVTTGGAPPAVLRVLALGGRVDHLRANAGGALAVAGDFGVAVLTGAAAGGPAAVAWVDALAGVEVGPCGPCCAGDGSTFCRLDIGDDGVVAARLAASAGADGGDADAGGLLWAAWTPAGARLATGAVRGAAAITATFVDAARRRFGIAHLYNSNTGREPMVMPRVTIYGYGGAGAPAVELVLLAWSATVYRSPGPCDGSVADARIEDLRLARDGTLLLAGRSDGGDSPFACGLRDSNRSTPFVAYDAYTDSANMQAQAITNFLRVDAGTGEAAVGQIQVARLPNSRANTLVTRAVHGDARGYSYELQQASYAIERMGNLTINGLPLAPSCDATTLLVASPALARRHWTHFVSAAAASAADTGGPVDIDVRGAVAAALISSSADLVQINALPGSAPNVNGSAVAYLVVLPTLGG